MNALENEELERLLWRIIDSAEMYIIAVENIALFKKFYEVEVR